MRVHAALSMRRAVSSDMSLHTIAFSQQPQQHFAIVATPYVKPPLSQSYSNGLTRTGTDLVCALVLVFWRCSIHGLTIVV